MARNIPKMIILSLALLKALDLKNNESLNIARAVLYLWREFDIKTRLEVIPKEFIVEFKYKDETISSCRVENLNNLRELIEKIKEVFGNDDDLLKRREERRNKKKKRKEN